MKHLAYEKCHCYDMNYVGNNNKFLADETLPSSNSISSFSVWDVLTLKEVELQDFWHIWFAMLVWMTLSYVVVHLVAFLLAVLALRHHSWMPIIISPFLVTTLVGPCTMGALTSLFLALTFSTANKSLGAGHCMLFGISQTALVIFTAFLRILATL